jgi:hypothetical protein
MQAHVEIGEAHTVELRHALLVYAHSRRAFASVHDVVKPKEEAPFLGPGQPLSLAFLRTLAQGLGSQMATEIFPPNVLARTPEIVVWWSSGFRDVSLGQCCSPPAFS